MMKLKKKNDKYREELKLVSDQLDEILAKQKNNRSESPAPNSNLAVDLASKKIQILEHEIKALRLKSPRSNNNDRLGLESTSNKLKEEIKTTKNNHKELERKIQENAKLMPESFAENFEKGLSELRLIKEKSKNISEKYKHEKKIHEQNLAEIEKLETKARLKIENNVDYLKFDSKTQNFNENDIGQLKKIVSELEQHKKAIEISNKQDSEKILIDIKEQELKLDILKKELKNKTHEIKIQDFEINNLKRKFRSVSTKRFELSPAFALEIQDFKEENKEEEAVFAVNPLQQVKSEERIPSKYKKPPRSDNNSPAAQKIKALRSHIEKVANNIGSIKPPMKSKNLVKIN